MKKIIKKLPKSLSAGFWSTVQETSQIPDCSFYLPVSMSQDDPIKGFGFAVASRQRGRPIHQICDRRLFKNLFGPFLKQGHTSNPWRNAVAHRKDPEMTPFSQRTALIYRLMWYSASVGQPLEFLVRLQILTWVLENGFSNMLLMQRFESKIWSKTDGGSQGCRSYFIHPGKPWGFPSL